MVRKSVAALTGAVLVASSIALAQPASAETAKFFQNYDTKASCAAQLAVLRNSGWVIKSACVERAISMTPIWYELKATR
jgi:hypothetical protein